MASERLRASGRQHGRSFLWFAAVLLTASTAAAEPSATEREAARQLMDEGDRRVAARDFAGALDAFTRAHALMHVPTTGVELARAQAGVGRLVEARDTALEVVRSAPAAGEPTAFTKARADAAKLAEELGARIPTVSVKVTGATEWTLRIDGRVIGDVLKTVPLPINPGSVLIEVLSPAHKTARRTVTVAERDRSAIAVALEADAAVATPSRAHEGASRGPASDAAPQDKSAGTSPLVWVGFGSAAAFAGVGAITGLISLSKVSDIKAECEGNLCPASTEGDRSSASTLAWASNIAFGLAAGGLVVGTVGLFASPVRGDRASVKPLVATTPSGGLVGLEGRFR